LLWMDEETCTEVYGLLLNASRGLNKKLAVEALGV
jgi:hypothetical protein